MANRVPLVQKLIESRQAKLKGALENLLIIRGYNVHESSSKIMIEFSKGNDKSKLVSVTPNGKYYHKGKMFSFVEIVHNLGILGV